MPAQKPNGTSFSGLASANRPSASKEPWAKPIGPTGEKLRGVDMGNVDVQDGDGPGESAGQED